MKGLLIKIDSQAVDISSETALSITMSVNYLTDISLSRTGYVKTLRIPVTARNRSVMEFSEDMNNNGRYVDKEHIIEVRYDGVLLLSGSAYLMEAESGTGAHYGIGIVGGGKEWIKYARATVLSAAPIWFSHTVSESMIKDSWEWSSPVRFFPIIRDGFDTGSAGVDLFPPVKILSYEDYHPFVHLNSLLGAIFGQAEYRINSGFMESEFFDSLYVSGNYPRRDTDKLIRRMDFLAGREEEAAAYADSRGYVYCDPYMEGHTIGNLVYKSEGTNGYEELFSVGGQFGYIDRRVGFSPAETVVAAFEYSIYYTTEYVIESRGTLKGFDTIYLGGSTPRKFVIPNNFTDRRGELVPGMGYTVVIFGSESGAIYRLRIGSSDGVEFFEEISGQWCDLTVPATFTEVSAQMYYKPRGYTDFVPYTDDWAIYDGYVDYRGEIDLRLIFRGPAERILPSEPYFFDLISFAGAESGMKLTVSQKTTIRPVFSHYPSEGSTVGFEDIFAHDISCAELISAVRHLFNLVFYTDEVESVVFIEPRDDFYHSDLPAIDWTDKIDCAKNIVVVENCSSFSPGVTLAYSDGDGAVAAWNQENADKIGVWTREFGFFIHRTLPAVYENLVFTPTLNTQGHYPSAPEASLIHVGDWNSDQGQYDGSLNFPMKIVSYRGMKKLGDGQVWGWPYNSESYPCAAFHYPGRYELIESAGDPDKEAVSLCFEDRDFQIGLHRYYDRALDTIEKGRKIKIWLRLDPCDMHDLLFPWEESVDLRSLFRLTINGETGLYRLQEVTDYNPRRQDSVECTLIQEI